MHTFKCSSGTLIHHNGDFDGEVVIHETGNGSALRQVAVRFDDLKEFIAFYVRNELMAFAENAPDDDILHHATTRIQSRALQS